MQMMQDNPTAADEILPEYTLASGVRRKYGEPFREGTNLVRLDPDVAEVFPDSAAVNRALRALAEIIRERGGRHAA